MVGFVTELERPSPNDQRMVVDGPVVRLVSCTVNGATPLQLTFNGNNWYDPVPYVLPVQLLGGVNTIVFSNPNPTGYAPGIDCIIMSAASKFK